MFGSIKTAFIFALSITNNAEQHADTISEKMNTVYVSRKKSGNYTITTHTDNNWELIAACDTPKSLKDVVNGLGNATVIKSEYSKSQLKTKGIYFNCKDSLRAFGISTSNSNIQSFFE